jgi:hypothetical protein
MKNKKILLHGLRLVRMLSECLMCKMNSCSEVKPPLRMVKFTFSQRALFFVFVASTA